MIEAAMLWNEPNNKSHWDFEVDPEWHRFAEMARLAAQRAKKKGGARRVVVDDEEEDDDEYADLIR